MKTLFQIVPQIVDSLSGKGLFYRIHNIITLWVFAVVTKFFKKEFKSKIFCCVNGLNFNFYIYSFSDLGVLKEVFVDKEYDWFPKNPPKVILDLGAHIGDTALFYHAFFPNALIIAVEPAIETYQKLLSNTSQYPNIKVINAAVGGYDGEVELNLNKNSLGSSLTHREGTNSVIKVRQLSLGSLLKECNLSRADIIKFDIEGAEFDLFRKNKPDLFSDIYIGEIHEDLANAPVTEFNTFFSSASVLNIEPLPKRGRYVLRAAISG